jgi:hypothetical protein
MDPPIHGPRAWIGTCCEQQCSPSAPDEARPDPEHPDSRPFFRNHIGRALGRAASSPCDPADHQSSPSQDQQGHLVRGFRPWFPRTSCPPSRGRAGYRQVGWSADAAPGDPIFPGTERVVVCRVLGDPRHHTIGGAQPRMLCLFRCIVARSPAQRLNHDDVPHLRTHSAPS